MKNGGAGFHPAVPAENEQIIYQGVKRNILREEEGGKTSLRSSPVLLKILLNIVNR
jgi:hypothetical protein